MRQRMELRLPAPLLERLGEFATVCRRTRTSVVEEALEAFLLPRAADVARVKMEQRTTQAPEKDLPPKGKWEPTEELLEVMEAVEEMTPPGHRAEIPVVATPEKDLPKVAKRRWAS